MNNYGEDPEVIGTVDLPWREYMHYQYLPVAMPGVDLEIPAALMFLEGVIETVAMREDPEIEKYIYITAKRRYATPDNPINRPGWHCDGFGSADVNYIWSDRWPTRFAVEETFPDISADHIESARQFDHEMFVRNQRSTTYPDRTLLRLTPYVVHNTPLIPAPGGERSFLKISVSSQRYNLVGNSHNFGLLYDWPMYERSEIRNDPAYAGGDAGPQT